MGQTVYVDVFFLINFSMDFLCYFLVAKLFGKHFSPKRGILGAAVGGIYADLSLFLSMGRVLSLAVDIGCATLMCTIFFYRKREGRALPLYVVSYAAVSMALGGFMTAFFHLLNRSPLGDASVEQEGDGISVWVFAILALISGALTYLGGHFFARKGAERPVEVEVRYGGRTARLRGMTDTGNRLRDPISGRMCMVADTKALSRILPAEILRATKGADGDALAGIKTDYAKALRVIPTHTATGEKILLAIRPDGIRVDRGKGFRSVDALVVLADLGEHAGSSQILLPPQLL